MPGPQSFVTGPVLFYVGLPQGTLGGNPLTQAGYTPTFFGTCEKVPEVLVRPHFSDVFNDIMGQVIPYDKIFEGEDALIFGDFTRYDEAILAAMQNRPLHVNLDRGLIPPGGVGTAMKTEGYSYPLWLSFPYALKAAYATMPRGIRFWATWLEGPDRLANLGNVARRTGLAWYASPVIAVGAGGVQQRLYDTLSGSFAALPAAA